MTTAVSGGRVWRFPKGASPNAASKPKVAKKNIIFLILSSVAAIVGAIFMCMAKPNAAPSVINSGAEGAIPVVTTVATTASLPAAPAIAMIIACVVSMVFLALAGQERGLVNLSMKKFIFGFSCVIIPLVIMLGANISLIAASLNQTKNMETSQWIQEHYNLTLTEPIDAETGQVEAKDSNGDTVDLNVLHFNGSTYIYRNDAELLSIMEKIKK